jgi:hypothetical protein
MTDHTDARDSQAAQVTVHSGGRYHQQLNRSIGILGNVLTVPLNTLVNLTGASLVADYVLIALAALFARPTGSTAHGPYKMPLWPLPPVLALASLGYTFTQQTSLLLKVTLITIAIGLVYWALVILPQRGRAWNLRQAAIDEEHPA